MLNSTFSIIYFLRTHRKRSNGKSPIYLRITIDGERSEISTKRYIEEERWSSETYRVIGNDDEAREINNYLTILHNMVLQAYNELMYATDIITAQKVKDKVMGREKMKYKLIALFEDHNLKIHKRIGVDYAKATYTKYKTVKKYTQQYLKKEYGKDDYYIIDIDLDFIEGFETFLKVEKELAHNTALKYIRKMKKIVLIARRKGIMNKDPFADFDHSLKEKTPTHLTLKELKRIENYDFKGLGRLERVADSFIFCCYTGLSYSDADKLVYNDFYEDPEGDIWLIQNRTKTDEPAKILLLPKALEIYNKYTTGEENPGNEVLPTISNQKTNAYLKEIATVSRINKNLTFHVARHTFATTITLANGMPIESVQIMMGHKDRRSTEHYARVTNTKLVSDMKKLKNIFQDN